MSIHQENDLTEILLTAVDENKLVFIYFSELTSETIFHQDMIGRKIDVRRGYGPSAAADAKECVYLLTRPDCRRSFC